MKIDKIYFRVFFLILCSAAFIFGAGKLGTFAYEKVFAEDGIFAKGTYIGSVSVEGLTAEKAISKLQNEIVNYQSSTELFLSYSDEQVTLPLERIQFYIEESVTGAVNGEPNALLTEINEKELHEAVSNLVSQGLLELVNVERLKKEIETRAGMLQSGEVTFQLYTVMDSLTQQILSEASINTGFIPELAGPVTVRVEPYSKFSFLNHFAREYPTWSNEMLTLTASALYQASLETNLQIIERQISSEQPLGIPLGFEAKVKRDSIDLVLENPNDFPLELSFQTLENGMLQVKIIGYPLTKRYEVHLSEPVSREYRQIVQYSLYLNPGEETIKEHGRNGTSIRVQRDVYDGSGKKINREIASEDFYLPVNQITVRSVLVEMEEEVPGDDLPIEQDETEITDEVEENKDQEETKAGESDEQQEIKTAET